MSIESAYELLFTIALAGWMLLIGAMLIRAGIGPRVTDRILSVNMLGTMVICCIMILSVKLGETFLLDVAIIYAMISFVSVIMLAATYIPSHSSKEALERTIANRIRRQANRKRKAKGKGGNAQ